MLFYFLLIQLDDDFTWEVSKTTKVINSEDIQDIKDQIKHLKFEKDSELEEFEPECFGNSKSLESVDLSNCLQLEIISEDVFINCTSLSTVILPGDDGSLETLSGGSFAYTAITSITFPKTLKYLYNHSITFKMGVFSYSNLSTISYYSENNIEIIDKCTFRYCQLSGKFEIGPNLEIIDGSCFERNPATFTGFTIDPDNQIYSVYKDILYQDIKLVFCPPGIANPNLKQTITTIGNEAFHSHPMSVCDFLPETVTCVEPWVFGGCLNLVKVILPHSLEALNNSLFSYCPKLITVIFPPNIKIIPLNLFYNSASVSTITIPYGVTEIQNYSFYGCKHLKYLYIPDTVKTFGSNIFSQSGVEECGIICSPKEVTLIKEKAGLGSKSFKVCKTSLPTCVQNYVHNRYLLFSIFIYYSN